MLEMSSEVNSKEQVYLLPIRFLVSNNSSALLWVK